MLIVLAGTVTLTNLSGCSAKKQMSAHFRQSGQAS